MVDTHCHLNFKAFDLDLDSVVRRYQEKSGEELICVGAKIDSSIKAIEIANKYPNIYASIGIHPHHTNTTSLLQAEEILDDLAREKKVVAVGETGLDNYQYKNYPPVSSENQKVQKELFLLHIKVAHKHNLPLIIHCRNAQKELLDILEQHTVKGVVHCFDGSIEYLKQILDLGLFIGFDGNITYKPNTHLRELVKNTPLDRLLLETDSPYLTPEPLRGSRNEPANLIYILKLAAQLKGKSEDKIREITSNNARLLFVFRDKI